MGVEIRSAIHQDLSAISALSQDIFRQTFGAHYTTVASHFEQYLNTAFSLEAFQHIMQDPTHVLWVCEVDSLLVGYTVLTRKAGKPDLEISRLYLDQSVHGRGIAHQVMEQSLHLARQENRPNVWLGVWQQNHKAIRFYAKWKFRIVGYKAFQLGPILEHDYLMYRKA